MVKISLNHKPLVSIVIPCRNEEKYIGRCLDSLISHDYPKERLEIIVVDGLSNDGTREILKKYCNDYPFIRMVDNRNKVAPSAMNIGIKESRGDLIIIASAHAVYDKNFVSESVKHILESGVDCVGGVCVTLPGAETLVARAIALALSHPFGVGNALFRIGSDKPRFVDTVPFGCYKREVFSKFGLFDEDLIRNQDDELNMRIIKNGGKILLVPKIISYYYARDSLEKLAKMYYQYGYFKPLVASKVGSILTLRQLVPATFVLSLLISGVLTLISKTFSWLFIGVILSYFLLNLGVSLSIVLREGLSYLPILPFCFATIHFSYGIGYLKGILDLLILKRHEKTKMNDLPLTR